MVQDQISFQFYRKIMFNTKKDLLDQGVLPLVNVLVLYFWRSIFDPPYRLTRPDFVHHFSPRKPVL